MLVKYLICTGICITVLAFNLFLCFISCNRLDKYEEQNNQVRAITCAVLLVMGIFFSIASGMGVVVLVTQTLAKFLQG